MTEYMNILGLLEHFVRHIAENINRTASINQQTDKYQPTCILKGKK